MASSPKTPVSTRALMTFALGLVVLGIGVAFFLAALAFEAAGATSQGNLLGPLSGIAVILGAVLAVGPIAKGS